MEKMTTTVFNLDAGEYGSTYSLPARDAVIAAHAQSLGDWNTWQYEEKYGDLVVTGDATVTCGSMTTRKDGMT